MADAFPVTIYHNPDCGTSRNTLAMIRAAGYEPLVVEYLKAAWTRELIETLLRDMGMTARELLREKGTPAAELGLLNHLAPLGWQHVNLTGDYLWGATAIPGPAEFRELRTVIDSLAA